MPAQSKNPLTDSMSVVITFQLSAEEQITPTPPSSSSSLSLLPFLIRLLFLLLLVLRL